MWIECINLFRRRVISPSPLIFAVISPLTITSHRGIHLILVSSLVSSCRRHFTVPVKRATPWQRYIIRTVQRVLPWSTGSTESVHLDTAAVGSPWHSSSRFTLTQQQSVHLDTAAVGSPWYSSSRFTLTQQQSVHLDTAAVGSPWHSSSRFTVTQQQSIHLDTAAVGLPWYSSRRQVRMSPTSFPRATRLHAVAYLS